MTLLIISPDYASHLLPLATLGTAWKDAGRRVVVASGPATAAIVDSFGFDRVDLRLGKGSNPGVIRAEQQPSGEDDALRGFFAATRDGMVETLAFQAQARLSDLMWEPVRTARAVQAVVADVAPDSVIVDHLAFSARLALVAGGTAHADVVLGHPSALPIGGEVYGFPPAWPTAFEPDASALAALRTLCERVQLVVHRRMESRTGAAEPGRPPSTNAFAEHGDVLLYNYPAELSDPTRTAALPEHRFLGSSVRGEPADEEVAEWLGGSGHPFVYVSFGSFLSVRADVLARVVAALAELGVRAAVALGSASRADLGEVPGNWLVREFLPQVTLLSTAAAAVTHGGNNSVTEAMTFGVPLVVLPFSTDQFAGAAAIERAGFGEALAPNTATVPELRDAIGRMLALPRQRRDRLAALSTALRQEPGRLRAFSAIESPKTN